MPQSSCHTPLGELTVSEEDGAIVALDWGRGRDQHRTALLDRAIGQLQDYFDGRLQAFDLPLAPHGTDFRQRLWTALNAIPYAETRTYGELARELGSAARAIGGACGANPIPIIIPCHRVLASGGSLGGYSGGEGAPTKTWLIEHERRVRAASPAGYASVGDQPALPLGPSRAGPARITHR